MEVWKDVEGYEGLYQVSNLGRVKSLSRIVFKKMFGGNSHPYLRKERIKKADISKVGYHTVELSKKGIQQRFKVHRLVMMVFKPIINHQDLQVHHIDNNPSNNSLDNLEWCSAIENIYHSVRQNRNAGAKNLPKGRKGSDINTSKLTEQQVKKIRISICSNSVLAKEYGVSKTAIRLIKIKKNWAHV
jgi:hypothetical protein